MFVLTQNSFIWTLETDEKLTVTTIEGPAVVDSIWKANANRSNVTQPNANSLVEVTGLACRTKYPKTLPLPDISRWPQLT